MPKLPTIHEIKTVASSRLFKIEQLELEFSNGTHRTYERLASSQPSGSAVIVIPMLDDETVFMIREYAAGLHHYELTLPKGRVEPGEDVLIGANRELMEEIGYAARKLSILKSVSLAPGYMQSRTHLVLAQDLYPATAEGDEPEPLIVEEHKLSEIPQLLEDETCTEGRTLLALFMARDIMQNH